MDNALMARPRCEVHACEMELVIPRTTEQRFVGTMYKCPICSNSILLPSSELTAFLEKQKGKI